MPKMARPLSEYAREVLISRAHPYFFYKARSLGFDLKDLSAVVKTFERHIGRPDVGNAIQHTLQWFNRHSNKAAQGSLARILKSFSTDPSWELSETSLISCDWVPPHTDDIRDGDVFASLVLGTGGTPYVVSLLQTQKSLLDRGTTVTSVAREVRAGDLFLFSPNRAHMAIPKTPKTGARLSLLQRWIRVGDCAQDWQRALLQHWPRAKRDELLYAEAP